MNEVKGEDMLYAKVNKLTMKEVFPLLFLFQYCTVVKMFINVYILLLRNSW